MKRAEEFVSAKEQEEIRQAEKELRNAYAGTNHSLIREKIEKLDQNTQKLAQGIMNTATRIPADARAWAQAKPENSRP